MTETMCVLAVRGWLAAAVIVSAAVGAFVLVGGLVVLAAGFVAGLRSGKQATE